MKINIMWRAYLKNLEAIQYVVNLNFDVSLNPRTIS